ncbi:hypothetical protein ACOMHN_026291 [Nucella lapillus]
MDAPTRQSTEPTAHTFRNRKPAQPSEQGSDMICSPLAKDKTSRAAPNAPEPGQRGGREAGQKGATAVKPGQHGRSNEPGSGVPCQAAANGSNATEVEIAHARDRRDPTPHGQSIAQGDTKTPHVRRKGDRCVRQTQRGATDSRKPGLRSHQDGPRPAAAEPESALRHPAPNSTNARRSSIEDAARPPWWGAATEPRVVGKGTMQKRARTKGAIKRLCAK